MAQRTYKLTHAAKSDVADIWDYTLDIWGETQADTYIEALYTRLPG